MVIALVPSRPPMAVIASETRSSTMPAVNSSRTAIDTVVEVYMTKIVNAKPIIKKCAVGEFVTPIAMGSPLNELDDTTLGVWPAVNGYCSASEDGDEILSPFGGMFPPVVQPVSPWTTYTGCPPGVLGVPPHEATPNSRYDPHGYDYTIDVKAPGATAIDVYDAEWKAGSIPGDGNQGTGTTVVDTAYALTWDNNTPLDFTDDVSFGTVNVTSQNAFYVNTWRTLFNVTQVGRYTMNVTTSIGAASHGSNSFGIRAYQGGGFSLCTSEAGAPGYSANCVQVSAINHLGVNAVVASAQASFYLASVDPIYAGHQMAVGLFDPGEGGQTIEILDPAGNPVSFTWSTTDNLPAVANATAYSGSGPSLDVSGASSPLPTWRRNPGKFNDRKVVAVVDLPSDPTKFCAPTCKTWWKLRYTFGTGPVSDRTTWDVSVLGDPVHLVNG